MPRVTPQYMGGAKETTHQGSPGAHMGSMDRHANLGAINLGWNVEYRVTPPFSLDFFPQISNMSSFPFHVLLKL